MRLTCCTEMRTAQGWASGLLYVMQAHHYLGSPWLLAGSPFKFCPWCGKKLPEAKV